MKIFITGVSSGIGRELACILIGKGHQVWGIARREDALVVLAEEINNPAFSYDSCDISETKATVKLSKKMAEQAYIPDIVILNAAVDLEDSYPGIDFANGAQMMRTNVDGANYWISVFIEPFLKRGSGQFIAISSIFAQWPDAASVSYSASKAALSMLLRGLRIRYAASNLQFKLLYLGPVATQINPKFSGQEPAGSLVVAPVSAAADYIETIISSGRKNFYYPFYIHLVFTFLRWLPDRIFQFVTRPFKR